MKHPIPGVDTVLFHKHYSSESIIDVPQDLDDLWTFNPELQQLPKDEYGFTRGSFHVMVVWTPEE